MAIKEDLDYEPAELALLISIMVVILLYGAAWTWSIYVELGTHEGKHFKAKISVVKHVARKVGKVYLGSLCGKDSKESLALKAAVEKKRLEFRNLIINMAYPFLYMGCVIVVIGQLRGQKGDELAGSRLQRLASRTWVLIGAIPVLLKDGQPGRMWSLCFMFFTYCSFTWAALHFKEIHYVIMKDEVLFRVLLQVVYGNSNTLFGIALNSGYSIIILRKWASDGTAAKINELFGPSAYRDFAMQEIMSAYALGMICFAFDAHMVFQVHLEMEAESSCASKSAIHSVLSNFCDAVVELDEELKVQDSGKKLAAFLVQGPHRSLQGTKLQDFMSDENDKKVFASSLRSSHNGDALTPPIHLHLRDSMGSQIPVEIFYAACNGYGNTRCYYLGIRDVKETEVLPPSHLDSDTSFPSPTVLGACQERTPRHKKKRRYSGQGTPSEADHKALADLRSEDSDSSQGSSNRSALRRLHPRSGLKPTSDQTQYLMLVDCVTSWCISSYITCCAHHAYFNHLGKMSARLRKSKCEDIYADSLSRRIYQCRSCGVLVEDMRDAAWCDWCISPINNSAIELVDSDHLPAVDDSERSFSNRAIAIASDSHVAL